MQRDNRTVRPFVLSRSHFAGSQRYAAIWTGDSRSTWEYLDISYAICLNSNLVGIVFCGGDVGGYAGDPDTELYQRWYQVPSIFYYRCLTNRCFQGRCLVAFLPGPLRQSDTKTWTLPLPWRCPKRHKERDTTTLQTFAGLVHSLPRVHRLQDTSHSTVVLPLHQRPECFWNPKPNPRW